ncbi:MAG: DUF5615 family PIN-like protein [Pirellulaceae bacterium]
MLRFLTDEDLRGPIVDGLWLQHPELDVVRAVDVGLAGFDDDLILAWAAANGRVTISHDVNTMIDAANGRLGAGQAMSGLIVVPQWLGIGRAIDELRYVAEVSTAQEMDAATVWLPI